MNIESSDFSKKLRDYQKAVSVLKSVQGFDNLPKDLKDQFAVFQKQVEVYDIEKHREKLITLSGPILTDIEVKNIVIEASGYTRWSIEPRSKEEYQETCQHYKNILLDYYNLDIAIEDIKVHEIARSTNSRNDIFLVQFACVPGHVYVDLHTGRVGYDLEKILPNESILERLISEFAH